MAALLVAVPGLVPGAAYARVHLTREQAFAQAFPGAEIEARNTFLTAEQVKRVEQAAAAKLASARVTSYRATRGDTLVGTAYLDTHPVRSQLETVMIVVTPGGRVGAVEVLAFDEPEDYLPSARWRARFDGLALSKDLKPGLAIPQLAGATLTARAISAAVRRALALDAELAGSR